MAISSEEKLKRDILSVTVKGTGGVRQRGWRYIDNQHASGAEIMRVLTKQPTTTKPNPRYCDDRELIERLLGEMTQEGFLRQQGEKRHNRTPDYYITQKGAEFLGDAILTAAFDTNITCAEVEAGRRSIASAGAHSTGVTMSDVETVLGTVIGKDSPITHQILKLLREQQQHGKQ